MGTLSGETILSELCCFISIKGTTPKRMNLLPILNDHFRMDPVSRKAKKKKKKKNNNNNNNNNKNNKNENESVKKCILPCLNWQKIQGIKFP